MSVTPAHRKLLIYRQAEPSQLCHGLGNKDFPYLIEKGQLGLSCPKQENAEVLFSGGLFVSQDVQPCVASQEYFIGF